MAEGLVTSDKLWVRWRQVSQLYQLVTSGVTVLFLPGVKCKAVWKSPHVRKGKAKSYGWCGAAS